MISAISLPIIKFKVMDYVGTHFKLPLSVCLAGFGISVAASFFEFRVGCVYVVLGHGVGYVVF